MVKRNCLPIMLILITTLTLVLGLTGVASGHVGEEHMPEEYEEMSSPFEMEMEEEHSGQGTGTLLLEGRDIYEYACTGCHGPAGDLNPEADFTDREFMEEMDDVELFAMIAEGVEDTNMRPFKDVFSEDEIWLLTNYLRSFYAEEDMTGKMATTIKLNVTGEVIAGETTEIHISVQDEHGMAVGKALVEVMMTAPFFIERPAQLGKARTDEQGNAMLEFVPRTSGDLMIEARFGGSLSFGRSETHLPLNVVSSDLVYQPQTHGGKLSWRFPLTVITLVFGVWATYFYSMFLIYRINRSKVIIVGLTVVVALSTMLITILVTSPDTHLHVPW